jgi:predicted metalloendopeptidase
MKNTKKGKISEFHLSNLNQKVRPQDDFYEYVNGGWIKNNPIPKTKSGWGTFYKVRDDVLSNLEKIAKDVSTLKGVKKGSETQLVRDLYLSGINTTTRNSLDFSPIETTFKEIDKITSKEKLLEFVISEHNGGNSLLWGVGVGADAKRSDVNITYLWQAGLSLSDRDFYLKTDKASKDILKKYTEHVENMFSMSCWKRSEAKRMAKTLVALETKIAKISMDKVARRNIESTYNKMSLKTLKSTAPLCDWVSYFKTVGLKGVSRVIVSQPDYLSQLNTLIDEEDIESWRIYLYWHILSDAAPYLSLKSEAETFDFFGRTLGGSQKMESLTKRIVGVVGGVLGEPLGKEYIKRHFPKEAKKKMDELVGDLFLAYDERMKNLDWMSSQTKKKARKKLKAITPKIGYPDKWESYRGLVIDKNDYYGNLVRISKFEKRKNFRKLKKKVDKKEWGMFPQTVNAYYSFSANDIVFPAGILQPPFFDMKSDAAFNYGAIGTVIGHEMTHGFDDQGSKFDSKGNFNNWWTKSDLSKFAKRANVLVKQFNKLKVGKLNVNGELTLGENIADLGGVLIAYDAYQKHLEKHGRKDISGFTPEQRFFMGVALFEAGHYTKARARMLAMTDPHSPAKYRINEPLANTDEFHDAFSVKKGDKMYRQKKDRVQIW